jgi:hypothetical protein
MFEKSRLKNLLEHNMVEIIGHSIFVSKISGEIAREMGLGEFECCEVVKAVCIMTSGR